MEFGGILMINRQVAMRLALPLMVLYGTTTMAAEINRYVRYSHNDQVYYGIEDGDQVQALDGPPWVNGKSTGDSIPLSEVTLLAPAEPSKVIAVGYNYISHREEMTHEEPRPIRPG